jgi:hypothetical protein
MLGCGVGAVIGDVVMEDTVAVMDREEWAAAQFAAAELGDRRRTKRLVRLAAMMAANSSGSLPQQTGGGADMKAAYRLFAAQDVTHAAVCQGHFEHTRRQAGQTPLVFLVQDTTVLNFSTHAACTGLGPIGDAEGLKGLHQQNVLAVWLLQLKFVARDHPAMPAQDLFEEPMVVVMARYLKRPPQTLTVGEFWRCIGRLGGHPGRKADGPIGWLRAWRGWQSFQLILLGASLASPHGPSQCG